MSPTINIILINYKNYLDTYECIYSLLCQNYKFLRIIIVDNDSKNDSFVKINELLNGNTKPVFKSYKNYLDNRIAICPLLIDVNNLDSLNNLESNIYFIESKINLGFGEANNLAMKFLEKYFYNTFDYFAFLNNDTYISRNILQECINFISNKKNVLLTSTILFEESNKLKIWSQGGKYTSYKASGYHLNMGKTYTFPNQSFCEVDFINGCFIFGRLDEFILNKFKFDKRFFLYGEDLDLSIVVKKKGVQLIVLLSSHLFHKVSKSHNNSLLNYYSNRNRFLIAQKWLNNNEKILFYFYIFISRILLTIKYLNFSYLEGLIDGITRKYEERKNK